MNTHLCSIYRGSQFSFSHDFLELQQQKEEINTILINQLIKITSCIENVWLSKCEQHPTLSNRQYKKQTNKNQVYIYSIFEKGFLFRAVTRQVKTNIKLWYSSPIKLEMWLSCNHMIETRADENPCTSTFHWMPLACSPSHNMKL